MVELEEQIWDIKQDAYYKFMLKIKSDVSIAIDSIMAKLENAIASYKNTKISNLLITILDSKVYISDISTESVNAYTNNNLTWCINILKKEFYKPNLNLLTEELINVVNKNLPTDLVNQQPSLLLQI